MSALILIFLHLLSVDANDQQPGTPLPWPPHRDEQPSPSCELKQALPALICFCQEFCHREEARALAYSNFLIICIEYILYSKLSVDYVCVPPTHMCMHVHMLPCTLGAQDMVVHKRRPNSTLVEFTISWKYTKENMREDFHTQVPISTDSFPSSISQVTRRNLASLATYHYTL